MENKSDYPATDSLEKLIVTALASPTLDRLGFSANDYPEVLKEIRILKAFLLNVPSIHRVEIIISFLKNHSLKTVWVLENPKLTQLVVSGSCKTTALEGLFEKFKNNKASLRHLEEYIDDRLKVN